MTDTGLLLVEDPLPGVRRLTMNRPEKRIITALVADVTPDVKGSILRGAGPSFSAGYDLGADNRRAVHRAMEIMGMRAAIRAGTELQALAFTTETSLTYRRQFERDGGSVRDLLSRRDAPFQDYRERRD